MKKIYLLIISVLLALGVSSCDETKTKMKAYEDIEVPHLDGGWTAVWADEFNGEELDSTKWNYEVGGGGGGNNELQYYTYNNALVSEGSLKIIAKKEDYNGKKYTSSRLVTSGKFSFKYGRVQVRAKVAGGRGTWPAIWMMPQFSSYGTWPNSGEIDIMEYVGYEKNEVSSSIHTKVYNHKIGTQQTKARRITNAEEEYHLYELIWEPGLIETYVDGIKLFTSRYTAAYTQAYDYKEVFPFDQEFFLILNLAIGGDWGGLRGVDDTIFPTQLEVDYVRVYQKDYNYYDKEKPEKPTSIKESILKDNSIYWNASYDDYGVSHYNIYIDGELFNKTNLPQTTLRTLNKGQNYIVEIEAVDFVGNVSQMSEPFIITIK